MQVAQRPSSDFYLISIPDFHSKIGYYLELRPALGSIALQVTAACDSFHQVHNPLFSADFVSGAVAGSRGVEGEPEDNGMARSIVRHVGIRPGKQPGAE